MSTQLTSANGYDVSRMIFSDPVKGNLPNSKPPISFQRINISTLYEDGSTGPLILPTSELFSFGVSENKDQNTQVVNGHTLPLCLFGRDGATPEEKTWETTFNKIVEQCTDHILKNKEELEQYDLTKDDLKKFNPLYWKKEKGKRVEGRGPTLYVKLISSKKQDKILSQFFDEKDNALKPLDLLGKYCFVKAAVKIESIFIGSKISLQVKLYEATVRLMEAGMKKLLPRPAAVDRLLVAGSVIRREVVDDSESKMTFDSEEDAGSLKGSDEEEEKPKTPPPPAPKRVVRRVKKQNA